MEKKIFIACPISKYLHKNGMDPNFEKFIISVYDICNQYSSNVFMALHREKFGKARMEDDVCTPLDYMEMKQSDIVIAIPEDSQGVAVELGWASAMNKKILVILNDNFCHSPLINAIHTVTEAKYYKISGIDGYHIEELMNSISNYLDINIQRRVVKTK